MGIMFYGMHTSFNGKTSQTWDTSSVTDMGSDVQRTPPLFNQPLELLGRLLGGRTWLEHVQQRRRLLQPELGRLVYHWSTVRPSTGPTSPAWSGPYPPRISFLDGQNPTYRIEPSGDSDRIHDNRWQPPQSWSQRPPTKRYLHGHHHHYRRLGYSGTATTGAWWKWC